MFKQSKRIVTTGTYAASTDLAAIDLPREGLITEVIIRTVITVTLAATAVADCTKRVIQNLKIQGDGGRTYLGLSGTEMGRLLNFMNACDLGTELVGKGGVLTTIDVGSTSFEQTFVFHPGSNPKDPFDLSAAIPARALSVLQLLLTCPAFVDTCDTAVDISAGTAYYQVNQVLDVPVHAGLMCPLGSTLTWPHDADYSDYGKKIDVPSGAWLRRIVMLVQDATTIANGGPLRKNDEVTGVKLELPKAANKEILSFTWQNLIAETAKIYGLNHWSQEQALGAVTTRPDFDGDNQLPIGLAIIDLRKYFHPVYGMDLTKYQTGDVKLGLTIENHAAGDDTILYWDQLQPVERVYVGK